MAPALPRPPPEEQTPASRLSPPRPGGTSPTRKPRTFTLTLRHACLNRLRGAEGGPSGHRVIHAYLGPHHHLQPRRPRGRGRGKRAGPDPSGRRDHRHRRRLDRRHGRAPRRLRRPHPGGRQGQWRRFRPRATPVSRRPVATGSPSSTTTTSGIRERLAILQRDVADANPDDHSACRQRALSWARATSYDEMEMYKLDAPTGIRAHGCENFFRLLPSAASADDRPRRAPRKLAIEDLGGFDESLVRATRISSSLGCCVTMAGRGLSPGDLVSDVSARINATTRSITQIVGTRLRAAAPNASWRSTSGFWPWAFLGRNSSAASGNPAFHC